MDGNRLVRRVRVLLAACEAVAVTAVSVGVMLALVRPGLGIVGLLRTAGLLVLVAAPFTAVAGVALSSQSASRPRRFYALGALLLAALGVWLAV